MKDKEKLEKERRRHRQRVLTQGDKLNYIKVYIYTPSPGILRDKTMDMH